MSQQPKQRYAFAEDLPLNPVDVGSNILVTEPTVGGTHKSVMKLLIGSGNEGLLFVTTSQTGRETIDLFEDCGGRYTKNRMAVVDASEEGRESVPLNIRTVSRPSNLTGINILYSSLYEQLQSSGIARVRTGFYDLSSLLTYNGDVRTIFRFLHTLTGRIKTSEGLGIFVIDPETQSEQTLRSLMQPFDGRIDIRAVDADAGEFELTTKGFDDQPEEWQSFALSGE